MMLGLTLTLVSLCIPINSQLSPALTTLRSTSTTSYKSSQSTKPTTSPTRTKSTAITSKGLSNSSASQLTTATATTKITKTNGYVLSSTTQSTSTMTNFATVDDSPRVIGLAVGLSIGIFAVIVVVVVICVLMALRRQKKHTPLIMVNRDDIRPAEHNVYGVMPSAPLDESGHHQAIALDRPGEVRELPSNSPSNQHQQLVDSEAEYRNLTIVENSIYEQEPTFDGSASVPVTRNIHINHAYDNCVTLIPVQPTTQSNNVNVSSTSTEPEDYIPRPSAEGHHNDPPIRHEYFSPVCDIPQK